MDNSTITGDNLDSTSTFAKRLSELMTDRGLTVRGLADSIEIPLSTLQSWRTGSIPTDFGAVSRLAKALNVSFEFLLTGNNSSKPGIYDVLTKDGAEIEGIYEIKIKKLKPTHNGVDQ